MTDAQRLPFPVHGTRRDADAPPAGVGEAARLLYLTNLIADTSGVPVFSMQRGGASASVHGALAFKQVRATPPENEAEEPPPAGHARLVWLPEGFVITPRTPGAPDGFGMPPTENGRGTPGGPLRQVIINRFADNQYPDAVYRWAGGSGDVVVTSGNLFFMDWEMLQGEFGVGVTIKQGGKQKFLPQFSERWAPLYREPDSGAWHCHRPMHHRFETPAQAIDRAETNLIREEVGVAPLAPPLRGMTAELSSSIAYQVRYSGVVEHDSPSFREGHTEFVMRARDRSGYYQSTGENIYFEHPAPLNAGAVHTAIAAWRHSPTHYANMTYDWAEGGEFYAWSESTYTASGNLGAPPKDSGVVGAQLFHGAPQWVDAAPGVHGGAAPITVQRYQWPFTEVYSRTVGETGHLNRPFMMYRGRRIEVFGEDVDFLEYELLSATFAAARAAGGGADTKKIRLAAVHRPLLDKGPVSIVVFEGAAHDFRETATILKTYALPPDVGNLVYPPQWSDDGEKMAFCYTELGLVPGAVLPPGTNNRFVGQEIHFVEFADGVFTNVRNSALTVVASMDAQRQEMRCAGTAEVLPVYDGRTLKFVTVEVDSFSSFSADSSFEKRVYGALVFPDGGRVVFNNLYAKGSAGHPGAIPCTGFVRHILPFDPTDSGAVAYIQYDWPQTTDDAGISASIVAGGREIKWAPQSDYQVATPSGPSDRGAPGPRYRNPYAYAGGLQYTIDPCRGNPYDVYGRGAEFFGYINEYYIPRNSFNAVIFGFDSRYPPYELSVGPNGSNFTGRPALSEGSVMDYVHVGPVLLGKSRDTYDLEGGDATYRLHRRAEEFEFSAYGGEWLLAGRVENTLGGTGAPMRVYTNPTRTEKTPLGAWIGEGDQHFYASSLDLKAITGIPDLKDNIMPTGVL